jgi:hypothetical protein
LWSVGGELREHVDKTGKRRPLYTLKYGKLAAKALLAECYSPGALALERKRALAVACVASSVGWSKSKTVTDPARRRDWKYVHTFICAPKQAEGDGVEIDPTAGFLSESFGIWRAGVTEWQTFGT